MKINAQILFCCALLTGCATDFRLPPLASDHPANPLAEEAPPNGRPRLTSDALTAKTKARLAAHDPEQSSMPGMQHDDSQMRPMSSAPQAEVLYTCPMHPEVQSDKPGDCPKCGMTLVKKQ